MNNSTIDMVNNKDLLSSYELQLTDKIEEPPVCLEISSEGTKSVFGTLSNFSVISGKAKSRKTFYVAGIAGATLKNTGDFLNIKTKFPENKSTVVYIDTEQAKYHAIKVLLRIVRIADLPNDKHPDNLKFFTLRPFGVKERIQIIDKILRETKNIGLVIIDGIRDLVLSINDEKEATEIATYLLKWTATYNIHIVTVIHQNKSDQKIRGHLGTELENKAESIVSISKINHNEDFSIVEAQSMRDRNFKKYSFGINEKGIPYLSEAFEDDLKRREYKYDEYPDKEYLRFVRDCFNGNHSLNYGHVWQKIKKIAEVGDNEAKDIFKFLKEEKNYIKQDKETKLYTQNLEDTLFD